MRSSGSTGSSVRQSLRRGVGSLLLNFRCWGWWKFFLHGGGFPQVGWRVGEVFPKFLLVGQVLF